MYKSALLASISLCLQMEQNAISLKLVWVCPRRAAAAAARAQAACMLVLAPPHSATRRSPDARSLLYVVGTLGGAPRAWCVGLVSRSERTQRAPRQWTAWTSRWAG
eukprot:COSAG02_NODE_7665_length_2906_cov_1.388671_4_plen_106_part_00